MVAKWVRISVTAVSVIFTHPLILPILLTLRLGLSDGIMLVFVSHDEIYKGIEFIAFRGAKLSMKNLFRSGERRLVVLFIFDRTDRYHSHGNTPFPSILSIPSILLTPSAGAGYGVMPMVDSILSVEMMCLLRRILAGSMPSARPIIWGRCIMGRSMGCCACFAAWGW